MCEHANLTTLPSGVVASFDILRAPAQTLPTLEGKLKLKSRLGEGACAVVFRGQYESQKCALKIYRPDCQALAITEGALLHQYQHRHIGRVLGLVENVGPFGGCALALELMDGGSMFRLISQQMASPHSRLYSDEDALSWMLQVASALQYLHQHDPCVVHRDLKQENIMFQKQNGRLVAKLIDFSLSTALTEDKLAASFTSASDTSSLLIASMPTQGSWPGMAPPNLSSSASRTPSPPSSTTPTTPTSAAAASPLDPLAASRLAPLPPTFGSPFLAPSPALTPSTLFPAPPSLPSPPNTLTHGPSDPLTTTASLLTSDSSSLPRPSCDPPTPCPTPPLTHLRTSSSDAVDAPPAPPGYVEWWKHPRTSTDGPTPPADLHEAHSAALNSGFFSAASSAHTASSYHLTGMTGSYAYMAPEVFNNQPYNEKSDVFSFGIMLYEIFARHLLVYHVAPRGTEQEMQAHAARTAKGYRPDRAARIPPPVWALIEACWDQDPAKRPSMDQAVAALHTLLHGSAPPAASKVAAATPLGPLMPQPEDAPLQVQPQQGYTVSGKKGGSRRPLRRNRSSTGSGCSVM